MNLLIKNQMKGLIIYPNYTYSNPNQKQFERLLSGLVDQCDIHILSRKGPRLPKFPEESSVFEIPKESLFRVRFQHALQKFCPQLAYCPDELRLVINSSLKKTGINLVKKEKYDFIATLSFPLSAQLVGYYLSKKFRIPWIAIFYDPWTDNPYRLAAKGFMKKVDAYYEALVAKNADAIIHSNKYIASIWETRYGTQIKNKIHVLPFCYSKAMMGGFQQKSKHNKGSIIISYVGNRFKQRNLQDVISSVKQLKDSGFIELERLKIRICGNHFEPDDMLIHDNGLSSIFEIKGFVPEDSLEEVYMDSDLFLVIDSPGSINLFYPSKLMDYFYYQKPIIGITPPNGVTADLLCASGNVTITNGDTESIKRVIELVCCQGPEIIVNQKDFWKVFSPQKNGSEFINIANSICRHN